MFEAFLRNVVDGGVGDAACATPPTAAGARGMSLRVLHVLDHSIPLHSGYTFRTLSILREQRQLGWETFHLTSPKQTAARAQPRKTVDGWHFYRTPTAAAGCRRCPGCGEIALMRRLERRLRRGRAQRAAGPAARPFAGAQRAAGAARRPPARHPGRLRGARLLGGRRGRPRHHHRRQPALPAHARARDARAAPRRSRLHDLRRPAQRHRRARHPRRQGHGDSERGRHRRLRARRRARRGAASRARPATARA